MNPVCLLAVSRIRQLDGHLHHLISEHDDCKEARDPKHNLLK